MAQTKTVVCGVRGRDLKIKIKARQDGNYTFYTVYHIGRTNRKLGVISHLKGESQVKVSKYFDGPSFPVKSAPDAFAFLVERAA